MKRLAGAWHLVRFEYTLIVPIMAIRLSHAPAQTSHRL
jgi:hypothetical protein